MRLAEAFETTCIHRVDGCTGARMALVTTRPCCAPPQTISAVGLIGGGHIPTPGEGSRVHQGVHCPDDLPKGRRQVLEALRQPLEKSVLYRVTLALSLFVALCAAEAQPTGNVARIGYLSAAVPDCSASPLCQTLAQRLQELGYVEGQNFRLEVRTAVGQAERLPDLAAELGRLPVDVIVAAGPEATLRAARHATRTIPMVLIAVDYDPTVLGYTSGLPQPGGNITGVVLQQDVPSADQWRAATEAAQGLQVQLHSLEQHQAP